MPMIGLKALFFSTALSNKAVLIYLKVMDKKLIQQYSQLILPLVSATLYLPLVAEVGQL